MKFTLNISNIPKDSSISDRLRNFEIPLCSGAHQNTFDLIKEEIPKDVYAEIVIAASPGSMPVGIRLEKMPVGSVLTKIE